MFSSASKQRRKFSDENAPQPAGETGLWSELSFRLRRPLGILFGIIDKLLITRSAEGELEIEIIDFKTNRITATSRSSAEQQRRASHAERPQFAFDFENRRRKLNAVCTRPLKTTNSKCKRMRSPCVSCCLHSRAARFASRSTSSNRTSKSIWRTSCSNLRVANRRSMKRCSGTIYSADPADFPVKTAPHCRMCNFLRVCTAGKEWVREN